MRPHSNLNGGQSRDPHGDPEGDSAGGQARYSLGELDRYSDGGQNRYSGGGQNWHSDGDLDRYSVTEPDRKAPGGELDYVLPLRWESDAGLDELTAYLAWLSRRARVIVVDGSPDALFARHARRWRGLAVHVPPDPALRYANGKVNGVTTGLRLAGAERVVIADDDVRYDAAGLAAMRRLLKEYDLVRPQNHFRPLPWHARWDTARTLVNRAFGADYPGTLGVRRACLAGGYDGDVLFENLELIRTVRARGGRTVDAPGLYVRRLPCSAGRFWSQRIRQAYDDLAQPARLALSLSVLPCVAVAASRGAYRPLLAGAAVAVLVAEAGRRRAGGRAIFPPGASLLAPVWILERGVCSWLALAAAVTGGVPYAGRRFRRAAHSTRQLRHAADSTRQFRRAAHFTRRLR